MSRAFYSTLQIFPSQSKLPNGRSNNSPGVRAKFNQVCSSTPRAKGHRDGTTEMDSGEDNESEVGVTDGEDDDDPGERDAKIEDLMHFVNEIAAADAAKSKVPKVSSATSTRTDAAFVTKKC